MRINFKSISHVQSGARNQAKNNIAFKEATEQKSSEGEIPLSVMLKTVENNRKKKIEEQKIKEQKKNKKTVATPNVKETPTIETPPTSTEKTTQEKNIFSDQKSESTSSVDQIDATNIQLPDLEIAVPKEKKESLKKFLNKNIPETATYQLKGYGLFQEPSGSFERLDIYYINGLSDGQKNQLKTALKEEIPEMRELKNNRVEKVDKDQILFNH